jgi:purine-nucleoside phosphorylase
VSANSSEFDAGTPGGFLVKELRRLVENEDFDLAIVLGSGWREAAGIGDVLGVFNYVDWPCFPAGQIEGHSGQLIAARYSTWNILFFVGRFHYYQGISAFQAAFPVRLASALGCQRILSTCAAGGINRAYQPGHFMLVEDHLNLLGDNPLRGLRGDIFVDLSNVYFQEIYNKLLAGDMRGITVHRGVLAAMPGPSYETPAEIRFLATAGIDVVSMSTVPEAIMARYLKMQVAAIAFIANCAAGLQPAALSHQEVLACGARNAHLLPRLVQSIINAWQELTAVAVE